MILHLEHNIH